MRGTATQSMSRASDSIRAFCRASNSYDCPDAEELGEDNDDGSNEEEVEDEELREDLELDDELELGIVLTPKNDGVVTRPKGPMAVAVLRVRIGRRNKPASRPAALTA